MLRSSVFRSVAQAARPSLAARMPLAMPLAVRFQSTLPRDAIESRVINVLATQTKKQDVTNTTTFEQLGLDSLDVVETLVAVEEEFGIEIPDADVEKIHSVKDTIEYIVAQSEAR